MNKVAITVLTRGYGDISQYGSLIKRNELIHKNIITKMNIDFDVIIFHEGDIEEEHQKYISDNSKCPLIFKDVKEEFNHSKNIINNELCPANNLSNYFSLGYKHMCHFWSIGFFKYLEDYNFIIRIDEDCFVNNFDIDIINNMIKNEIVFISPEFQGQDTDLVICGLERLWNEFLQENNIQPFKSFEQVICPYTNFMIVNIEFLRNNQLIQNFLKKIDDSNCIYSNRWGDLPIWGLILSTLLHEKHYCWSNIISYHHGSHNKQIN